MSDQSHHQPTGPTQNKLNHSCPPGLKIVYSNQAQPYRMGHQQPAFNGISQMLNNFLDWLAGSGQKKHPNKVLQSKSILSSPSCFTQPLVIPTNLPDYGFRPRVDPAKFDPNRKF